MLTTDGYLIALIKLMDRLPNRRGEAQFIIRQFERGHRQEIPREHFKTDSTGMEAWVKRLQWSRQRGVMLGWMDSPARGIWRLTEKGHAWLEANPHTTHAPRLPVALSQQRTERVASAPTLKRAKEPTLPSRRARLEGDNNLQQKLLFEKISELQNFLDGRSNVRPSDEQLCDWVNFCYSFELYAEGAEVFRLVARENVNEWYYERTRKLAKICEIRTRG